MSPSPKHPPVSDRAYLDSLRDQTCLFTGQRATENERVDPAHIGTYGKGMKTDDEALPIIHSLHAEMHARGEMSVLRARIPSAVLRAALRALAHEMYAEWKNGGA